MDELAQLPPEIFEKLLPFAIVLGVEKKWAKAFESMHLPQPNWYAGSAYATGSVSSPAGLFSPVSFSKSFSSSFENIFQLKFLMTQLLHSRNRE